LNYDARNHELKIKRKEYVPHFAYFSSEAPKSQSKETNITLQSMPDG